jgi:uncharacterized protein YutE (UPF0331/DUF86 family)
LSADRSAINARLAALPHAYDDLLAAASSVGDPLDARAVLQALESSDPVRRNLVGALERVLEKLINYLAEITERGLREAERVGHASGATRGRSFDRLREAGVISRRQRDRLVLLVDVRNLIQHDYVAMTPGEIVAAAATVREELTEVVRALAAWIGEVDGTRR